MTAFSAETLAREIIEDAGPDDLDLLCKQLADRTPGEHLRSVIEQVSRPYMRYLLLHPRTQRQPGNANSATSWKRGGRVNREAAEARLARLYFRGVHRDRAFLAYTAADIRLLCMTWEKKESEYARKRSAVEPFAALMEQSDIATVADLPDEQLIALNQVIRR